MLKSMLTRPATSDYAEYFQGYVDRVPDGDVLALLPEQCARMQKLLRAATEEQGDFAYAPEKWSVKRLVLHIADSERMFCYRAMCLARIATTSTSKPRTISCWRWLPQRARSWPTRRRVFRSPIRT